MDPYDLIIIGGSAAATTAGIYAARRNLNFKIITKEFGGEVATSGEIGNWPGDGNTNGIALAQKFREHLDSYKINIEDGVEVLSLAKQADGLFCITTRTDDMTQAADKMPTGSLDAPKCDYIAKTVIVTTGAHPRTLDVPGEVEYRNKGVTYCTVCDGPLFGDKVTAVVGGGNSALEAALMLTDIASKVYVINKNAQFKGEKVLIDNLLSKKNVEVIYEAKTTGVQGAEFVTGLAYTNKQNVEQKLIVDGVFIHIGLVPNSYILPSEIEKDSFGYVKVNANCETNIPGLFAAGDVTDVPFKQIVIAAGQGTIALLSAVGYLNRL